ncbi:MAG: exopolyphosphatase [Cyclobacteriaceae bacterium]|nr:exopolyphosphatase [Cyclobacteriaceae bacterium]
MKMEQKIAVIDLGTNTFHLLITGLQDGDWRIIHSEKQAVKIGVGGINQNIIPNDGMERAIQCLKNYKIKLDEYQVALVLALGTSALRNAKNSKEVINKIYEATGITVHLISGEQEAEYIYYGVRSAVTLGDKTSMIVDIGGGSVEFIIGDGKDIFWKQSFEIGAQRLLEMYHKHDPILESELVQLNEYFEKSLGSLQDAVEKYTPTVLAGSSGTFDTLSEIYCMENNIPISKNDAETPLTIEAFHKIYKQLVSKNRAQRMQVPGMIEMRVDMIVVGSCLVDYLIKKFNLTSIRVSSYSLKEGAMAIEILRLKAQQQQLS